MKLTKTLIKLLAGTALTAAAMTAVAAPANAGVSVGIGIGVPAPAPAPAYPHRRWCYWHPRACGYYGPPAAPAAFVVGNFYAGRGWWDGHAWWHHRYWGGGHWRYR